MRDVNWEQEAVLWSIVGHLTLPDALMSDVNVKLRIEPFNDVILEQ